MFCCNWDEIAKSTKRRVESSQIWVFFPLFQPIWYFLPSKNHFKHGNRCESHLVELHFWHRSRLPARLGFVNSPFPGECCFGGRCFSKSYRCQSRKPLCLALQPLPVSQPQVGLCLRDANSSCTRCPLRSAPAAAPASHRPRRFSLALV